MNVFKSPLIVLLAAAAIIAGGCSGSKGGGGTNGSTTGQTPSESASKSETGGAKADTFDVKVNNAKKPPYETAVQQSGFTVQIGAYQKQENADRVASLARERFTVTVNTILDKTSGLYKVLVGSFTTKEQARSFRDDMVQKYPSDYKDAWTTDIPQQ
jgi:cell division protein FtsN